ncbi:hypothetical protein [Staphylococcus phage vB_SsapH-Golestan101-M]|nr:hypothetical protein [Staphylococcus phage vB_SsapH-Golestan101-M]
MNRLQEFLQGYEESTVKDVAEYGIESGAIGELIYTEDVVNFFNSYYSEIEAVITEYAEELTHGQFYDLIDTELMELFNSELNTSFTTGDEMLDLLQDEATQLAETDVNWYDMDEEEQEELIMDCMDDVEVLPTTTDMVQFVALAVELVAQDMQEG